MTELPMAVGASMGLLVAVFSILADDWLGHREILLARTIGLLLMTGSLTFG